MSEGIAHERAAEAVQRLINSHFHNDNRARCSIPARPDEDDDLIASRYVQEQKTRDVEARAAIARLKADLQTVSGNHKRDCEVDQARIRELEQALDKSRLMVQNYCVKNPKWVHEGKVQDPGGAHALLVEIDAALSKSKEPR